MSQDATVLVSASTDKSCRVFNASTGDCIKKLVFSEDVKTETLEFRGCRFTKDMSRLFTLATKSRGSSFLTIWDTSTD